MWPWRRERNGHDKVDAARARAAAEAKARAVERQTPLIERLASHMHQEPVEEFADRVSRAMGRRP